MPSVAEEPSCYGGRAGTHGLTISTKKRRWEDASTHSYSHVDNDVVSVFLDDDMLSQKLAATASIRSIPCPTASRKIIPLASKRRRLSNCENSTTTTTLPAQHTSPLMLPCHVCQRKPRRKSDLDSQADCEGCGQRACFVCLRECSGWTAGIDSINSADSISIDDYEGQTPTDETNHMLSHFAKKQSRPWSASSRGHRRIVCSRCCVERGEDGEVVCLGCMSC